jgi:hypothetical protein
MLRRLLLALVALALIGVLAAEGSAVAAVFPSNVGLANVGLANVGLDAVQ